MLIDWFTVAAQAVNFLVLVWLLKRFLYKPILDAIAAREKRIADQLAAAVAKEAEAKKEQEDFRQKNEAFDQQKAALMEDTQKEAKTIHQQLLKEARAEADRARSDSAKALGKEQQALHQEIIRRTREEIFALAAKVLRDLADTDLQERMIAVFIRHLQILTDKEKQTLLSSTTAADDIWVSSAFPLQSAQQDAIKTAVKGISGLNTDKLRFKTTQELISGIELYTGGYKLAWSVSDYLTTLQNAVETPVDKLEPQPEAAHAA